MDGKLGHEGRNGKARFPDLRASAERKSIDPELAKPARAQDDGGWDSQPKPKLTYLRRTTETR
jgi:hypothetical protein